MQHQKPHADSYLATLNPEQRAALFALLDADQLTYEKMVEQLPPWPGGEKVSVNILSKIYGRRKKAASRDAVIQKMLEVVANVGRIQQELLGRMPSADEAEGIKPIMFLLSQLVLQELAGGRIDQEVTLAIRNLLVNDGNRLKEKQINFDQARFVEARRTKIEAGLDSLADTVKGNSDAIAAVEKLREVVRTQLPANQ
jgi:hypothetical protein